MNFENFLEKREKLIIRIIIVLFFAIVFCLFLFNERWLNRPIYMSLLPILAFAILAVLHKINLRFVLSLKKVDIILCGFLSLLFFLMLSFTEILKAEIFDFDAFKIHFNATFAVFVNIFLYALYLPSVLLSAFLLLCKAFSFSGNTMDNQTQEKAKISFKDYYKPVLLIAILSLAFMIACYPGYMGTDSTSNWGMIQSNQYSDWHCIGYVLIIKLASLIWNKFYFITIIQTCIWVYGNYMAIKLLYEVFKNKKILSIYSILICLMLVQFHYLIIYYKDVLFFTLFYCYFICILRCCIIKQIKITAFVKAAAFGGLASLTRHFSFVYILFPVIILIIRAIIQKNWLSLKRLSACAATVILINLIVVQVIGFGILKADKNPSYVAFTTPINMIGAVVASGVELDNSDVEIIERIMPMEKWAECYNKYWADDLAREWGKIGGDVHNIEGNELDILKLNLKFFFKYPKIYITAIFDTSSIVWEIGRPQDGYEWPFIEYKSFAFPDDDPNQIKRNIFTLMIEPVMAMLWSNPITSSMWRGGLSLFLLTTSFVLLCRKKKFKESFVVSSVLLSAALFFLSIPAQDPRYIMHFISTSIFSLVYAISCNKKQEDTPVESLSTDIPSPLT